MEISQHEHHDAYFRLKITVTSFSPKEVAVTLLLICKRFNC